MNASLLAVVQIVLRTQDFIGQNSRKNAFGVGRGWRLNWNQSLRRELLLGGGDYYYVLTDGD